MSTELLNALAQFDTSTICNVIELFEVRPDSVGFTDSRIRAAYPSLPPMVGYATTATFRSAAPPKSGSIYSDVDSQLEQIATLPGPAVVVFQDLDDPPVGATFGEIMCSIYRAYGAVGLITSGGGRDLLPIEKLRFPVFTGSTICSHAHSHVVDVGRSVRVGGLVVNHGDLLHGDGDGVTTIPLEIADEIPPIAAEYVLAERILIDFAQSPGPKTLEQLKDRRRAAGEAMTALRRRVSRRAR
jgi:4-hydroxy-4-methyl-2-oxoglutarate aldolase